MPRSEWLKKVSDRGFARHQRIQKKGRWKKEPGEAAKHVLLTVYAGNAYRLGRTFDLTKEQFAVLTKGDCHYCGKPPSQIFRPNNLSTEYVYNGIDRVDNSLGYSIDNCVPCCKICNKMKSTLSAKDFLEHVAQIVRHGAHEKHSHGR